MNRYFIKKAITACLFLIVIVSGLLLNIQNTKTELKTSVTQFINQKKTAQETIEEVNAIIEEQAVGKYPCIELYGYFQRLMKKNEYNNFEVIKNQDVGLTQTTFQTGPKDIQPYVKAVTEYKENLKQDDAKLIYIMLPDKLSSKNLKREPGLPYDYTNESADLFLKELEKEQVSTIDLRKYLPTWSTKETELFYQTDHHWKIETAFQAFQQLVTNLSKDYGLKIEQNDPVLDLNQYNQIVYKDSYLGSLGRKTGVNYGGVDDFTLIYPKFKTNLSYEAQLGDYTVKTSGTFDQALIKNSYFQPDVNPYKPESDMYSGYLYGNNGIAHITNHEKKDGPKMLFVKDSFMLPVAAFFSNICSDVYLIDPRYYEGDITEYTNSLEGLDYIFLSYSTQSLADEFFELKKN